MKRCSTRIALFFAVVAVSTGCSGESELPLLEGPYLGQEPPGSTPKVFAPGVVSTPGWEGGVRFSLDMNELYFTRLRPADEEVETVVMKTKDNRWYVADKTTGRAPFFAPDGQTLHFGTRYKERTNDGWSEMKSLGSPFEEIRIMSLTVSNKGTYAFDEATADGNGILRYSRLIDGKREEPKPLDEAINTGKWNAHPFIAPDESFIMWDGERESGYGDSDLYVSFRQQDGSWGEAINLGDAVNTEMEEGGPRITPDGRYLFFSRVVAPAVGDGWPDVDTYWVDAQIIEDLRPKP